MAQPLMLDKNSNSKSLEQYLSRNGGWLPLHDALIVIKAISSILGTAHSRGIVHGEVTAKHVMISPEGNISLTGFRRNPQDRARTVVFPPAVTGDSGPTGAGKDQSVSPRLDIAAEALLFYEMLTGERLLFIPGEGVENPQGILAERIRRAQMTVPPPNPRQPVSKTSSALAGTILTALGSQPGASFQDANGFFLGLCKAAGVFANEVPGRIGAEVPVTGAGVMDDGLEEPRRGWRPNLPYFPFLPVAGAILSFLIVVILAGGYIFFPDIFAFNQPPKLLPGYAYVEQGAVVNQIPGGEVQMVKEGGNIPFGPGSVITVGSNMVSLILPGNYRLKIAGNPITRLELVQAWSEQSTVTVIRLFDGSLFLVANEQSDPNRPIYIQTDSGRATLFGSVMGNRYDPSTQIFAVDCVSGLCRLEAEEVVNMVSGERSQVDSSGVPVPPSPMDLSLYHGYDLSFFPIEIIAQNTATPRVILETPTPNPTVELPPTPVLPTWTPIPTPIPNTGYGR